MNMRLINKVAGATLLLCSLASLSSCVTEQGRDKEPASVRLRVSGTEGKIKALEAQSGSFFVKLTTTASWQARFETLSGDTQVSWISLSPSSGGKATDMGLVVSYQPNSGGERAARLIVTSQAVADTLTFTQQAGRTGTIPPVNPNPPSDGGGTPRPTPVAPTLPEGEIIDGDVTLIEVPRLAGGNHNYFVTHRINGKANYSLEWDVNKRHSRWVCFTFDASNSRTGVKRTDAWGWDPKIPSRYEVDRGFFSGYDRGHLVASSDRTYDVQANKQTFYYSNMSPQMARFNQDYWNRLEQRVQGWGRNNGFRDVLYVVKGGTIAEGQYIKKMKGIMPVPKYYFMALVAKKGSSYKGIAFWLEHKQYKPEPAFREVAVSIDKLEELTGIDFFHNLPDDIEARVEAEQPSAENWPGI